MEDQKMSLQSDIKKLKKKLYVGPECFERRIRNLENWKIKLTVYMSLAGAIIMIILGWYIKWTLDDFAETILSQM